MNHSALKHYDFIQNIDLKNYNLSHQFLIFRYCFVIINLCNYSNENFFRKAVMIFFKLKIKHSFSSPSFMFWIWNYLKKYPNHLIILLLAEAFRAPLFRTGEDKHGFSLSRYNNFCEVFGDNPKKWFLPIHSRSVNVSPFLVMHLQFFVFQFG